MPQLQLQQLSLWHNRIGEADACALTEARDYAPQLQWLFIEYKGFGEAGARALTEAASLLPGLRLSV